MTEKQRQTDIEISLEIIQELQDHIQVNHFLKDTERIETIKKIEDLKYFFKKHLTNK